MKNEVIETSFQKVSDLKNDLAISGDDIARVIKHLELVKEVVSKVLKEGKDGEGDYGLTTGTKKKALYKPGAEKLRMIFGLGVRFILKESQCEFDRYENFAKYSYDCEVYHLKTGIVIATCEGTANSWEKKYKERAVYVDGVFAGKEPMPVSEIQNTLKKMAQKRAFVGGIILATAASDYFTQDEEDIEAQQSQKKTAGRSDGSQFKTEEPKDLSGYVVPIGKFKGKKLKELEPKELSGYVQYMAENNPSAEGPLKQFIDTAREFLRNSN